MRICYDNLEDMEYLKHKGEWRYKNRYYGYEEKCLNCGDPFLALKYNKGKFCDKSCMQSGKHNNFLINDLTKENHSQWKGGYATINIADFNTYSEKLSWCEQVRRNKIDKNILEVKCAYCGKWFIPSYTSVTNRLRSIEGRESTMTEARFYCSDGCKQECPIYRKIKHYKGNKPATSREVQPQLRQLVFERDNYTCQKCESQKSLHCHHVEGIRWEPLESADMDKCITLCKGCHKKVHKLPDCGYNDFKCREVV